MQRRSYDIIVIGLGVMGSAAACEAARRGARVLGLEAHAPHHALGSSHGEVRAIRETYFESPDYVPLALRSHDAWRTLEAETGRGLLTTNGALYGAPEAHPLLAGVMRAAEEHGLDAERLDRAEIAQRFPGFTAPEGWAGVYEPRGGVLNAPGCLDAMTGLARRAGAELRYEAPALSWRRVGDGVEVETAAGVISAGALIVTVGPWACGALAGLGLPIMGRRVVMAQYDAMRPDLYPASDYSVYFWAAPEGVFAGFPHFDGQGVKICRHDADAPCTPETIDREVRRADTDETTVFAARYLPHVGDRVRDARTCMYTVTPDGHPIIDRCPETGAVYAAGFNGHGFKFAPVFGEALADIALTEHTYLPVGFLAAERFQNAA
jgi:sarcosine oxidase